MYEKIDQMKNDNNFDVDIQMATGSEVTSISKKFLESQLYERAYYLMGWS